MKKRLLAFACVLAILVGMFVVPVSAEEAAEGTGYQVGYAKVDVNPWVDLQIDANTTIGISASDSTITEADAATYIVETQITNPMTSEPLAQKIVAVPLAGYGNSTERLATGMMDDNGDGVIGYGDGLFSTCTTVTDANDKTVVYVTIDCIRASSGMTRDIRNAIVAAIGSANVSADQIMVSASHSHSAPDYAYSSRNTVWKAYYDYVIARIASAAKTAFDTKSAAEMSKGSIEAPEGMANRGYGDGVSLNFVRHAVGDYTLQQGTENKEWSWDEWGYVTTWEWNDVETQKLVRTPHSGQYFAPNDGREILGTRYKSTYVLSDQVSKADETLHVLQFTREEGDPVLLVNWRAHATMNGGGTNPVISSDYINSLRYTLENAGYCVGFWQGAAGNVNAGTMDNDKSYGFPTPAWKNLEINGLGTAAKYGYLLAEVTLACLDSTKSYMQDCEESAINNRQALYNVERQTFSDGLIAAAQYCYETTGGNLLSSTSITYPFAYEYNGETYVLNSDYHANVVYTSIDKSGSIELELNVITMGNDVTLVTLPVEPFDRYSNAATLDSANDYNDWENLDAQLGHTPFVLGYSNDHNGYLGNNLSYIYGPSEGSKYSVIYGMGSYETNTSSMAQGAGEAVVAELGNMIEVLATGFKTADCEACGTENAQWTPLTHDQLGIDLTSGHYYLAEDITATTRLDNYNIGSADSTETVCLDLNGNTLDYKGQVFLVYADSVLNIMDTATEGKIIARSGGDLTGGLAWVYSGGTLNLHDGILQFIKDTEFTGNHTARGGVIYNSGTLNIYDGTIIGGEIVVSDWTDSSTGKGLSPNGVGGAVAVVGGNATLNMFGGRIESGPSVDGVMGSCVYVTQDSNGSNGYHAINLTGDAYIEEIYVMGHYTNPRSISVSGKFTGGFALNLDSSIELADEVYVARVVDGADFSEATLRCVNEPAYTFEVSSSNANRMIMVKQIYDAIIDGVKYESLTEAITNYSGGEIQLLRDVTEDVVVENANDVYLDMNGYDIKNVDVAEGSKLICWDFQTYDYTVEDGFGYGIIGSITGAGTVDTLPVEEDGYVMLGNDTNDDGVADQNVSFHHVNLNLTDMTLRPKSDAEDTCNPSMYYKSNFAGDEVVKENVKTFGVALSLVEVPNETNMGVTNKFSWFDGANFAAGGNNNDATSTLLCGIMNEENGRLTNSTNSTRPIYGRAYIQLNDGSYVFGASHTGTLKSLTEGVDDQWADCTAEQIRGLVTMYETYQKIMKNWDVTNISTAYEEYLASKNEG
ncbi:MAG: hypothetical protein IJX37_02020 [Oscillospiraceae bacterium]|nr:hypothetical protein [Oscillospiraceae bacterium]